MHDNLKRAILTCQKHTLDLRGFALSDNEITDIVELLNEKPSITSLRTRSGYYTHEGFIEITKLTHVKSLSLTYHSCTDEGIIALLNSRKFTNIDVNYNRSIKNEDNKVYEAVIANDMCENLELTGTFIDVATINKIYQHCQNNLLRHKASKAAEISQHSVPSNPTKFEEHKEQHISISIPSTTLTPSLSSSSTLFGATSKSVSTTTTPPRTPPTYGSK